MRTTCLTHQLAVARLGVRSLRGLEHGLHSTAHSAVLRTIDGCPRCGATAPARESTKPSLAASVPSVTVPRPRSGQAVVPAPRLAEPV